MIPNPAGGGGLLGRFRLDGVAAVVTGSGRGIGRAIAAGLAEAGADVVVNARRRSDLEATASAIRAAGRRCTVVDGDVRAEGVIERLGQEGTALGPLGVWVNNVGGSDEKTTRELIDTPDDVFRAQVELNLTTAFRGCREAATRMDAGGAIVNIASGAGTRGSPRTGPYAAAKAGLVNITQTLALELAGRGIRVNAVSPGPVPTEAFREVLGVDDDARRAEIAATIPLGRLGTPEDIAAAVLYLASPAAAWVTGQHLLVAGGRTERTTRYGRPST